MSTAEQPVSLINEVKASRRKSHRKAERLPFAPEVTPSAPIPQVTLLQPPAARRALAKTLRKNCSRKSLGGWRPPKNRPDPIDILIATSKGRVESLVPIRYARMMASPFAFYRGGAALMASDLSTTASTGVLLQICGDAHLVNFGGFATPERELVFDINDFDETTVGPWEWDVKRLGASFVVAARANGLSAQEAHDCAWEVGAAYRDHLAAYAEMPLLDAWYDHMNLQLVIDRMQDPQMKKLAAKTVKKAMAQTAHTKEFAKLAVAGGSPPKIQDQPPLIYHDMSLQESITAGERAAAFEGYRNSLLPEKRVLLDRFRAVDYAVKVVGVGSVGTYCGIILMVSGNGDPLFLQFKEARDSVIDPFIGKNAYAHQGQRVVAGQRLMQSASDMFLGWTEGPKRHFYIRQLRDAKISPQVELMGAATLRRYGHLCAHALARAHARSGDAVLLSAYLGKSDAFADALASFSVAYADQNERDHAAMVKAARAGRIDVATLS